MRKFPIIRPAAGCSDIVQSFFRGHSADSREFCTLLGLATGSKSVYLVNSGLAAFYLILTGLKARSPRREVVLPAYTAGSLVVAIKKAGLTPVLCDISLDDFNLDREHISGCVSDKTLAVVGVHMFGIPMAGMAALKSRLPAGVCLIEDCCQAQGAKIGNTCVGVLGDISFFSFNRGKNLSTFGGGCVAAHDPVFPGQIEAQLAHMGTPGLAADFALWLKMLAANVVTNPAFYGYVYPLLQRFKEIAPPENFSPQRMSGLQCSLGAVLAEKMRNAFEIRSRNGKYLSDGLQGIPGIRLAKICADCYPAYNRLPVLFEEPGLAAKKIPQLWRAGYESSRMYLEPLHKMFELGYGPEEFPNANYFSRNVLTLPVYPGLERRDLDKIIEVIKE